MPKNKRHVRVAVIGAGKVANSIHLPAWRKIDEANVVAVCDRIKERAEVVAKKWNIPLIYTDYEKLLKKEEVDIVDLCTPPETHASLSIKAMESALNVALEKPMAMSLEESERIFKEYLKRRGELKLLIIHNYLFSPSMLKIKSILQKNKVEVLNVDIRMLSTPKSKMLSDSNHWVHSLPGGRISECLIHPIYLLRNLLGSLQVREVYVKKRGNFSWVKYDELYASFSSNEKSGNIYISFNSPRKTPFPTMRIYGRNLILNFDGTNSTIILQKESVESNLLKFIDSLKASSQIITSTVENAFQVLIGKWRSGHETLFRYYVDSIIHNKEEPYSPEEAYDATKSFLETVKRFS